MESKRIEKKIGESTRSDGLGNLTYSVMDPCRLSRAARPSISVFPSHSNSSVDSASTGIAAQSESLPLAFSELRSPLHPCVVCCRITLLLRFYFGLELTLVPILGFVTALSAVLVAALTLKRPVLLLRGLYAWALGWLIAR